MAQPATPQLITTDPVTTAVVRATVPMAELPAFYDRVFSALPEVLAGQGVDVVGPAFGLYRGVPTDTVDLEVGFPVQGTVTPEGDVVPGELPGGRAAWVIHPGSFDGLGEAWQRLGAWIGEQDLTPGTIFWEVYLTEPSPDMDPDDLRTELTWPVG